MRVSTPPPVSDIHHKSIIVRRLVAAAMATIPIAITVKVSSSAASLAQNITPGILTGVGGGVAAMALSRIPMHGGHMGDIHSTLGALLGGVSTHAAYHLVAILQSQGIMYIGSALEAALGNGGKVGLIGLAHIAWLERNRAVRDNVHWPTLVGLLWSMGNASVAMKP